MRKSWYMDPAIILEREDNRRSCPACQFNRHTKSKNGYKQHYCAVHHDQQGGTQTAESCRDWIKKRVGGYGKA